MEQGSEHFRKFYARLKKGRAMSYAEALETLGFKSDEHPSAPEIARAYKTLVVKNHPDLGGSHEKMVDLNIAKEILDGKQRPTYERSEPTWSPQPRAPRPPPAKKVEITFDEAKSKAGVPSNVEWLMITSTQRSRDNYSGDESSKYDRAWVVYGRTADSHVFLGIENTEYSGLQGDNDAGYDKWAMHVNEYTSSTKVTPSWLHTNIARMLGGMTWFSGSFNSKVVEAKGLTIDERAIRDVGGKPATSIKNLLVNMGEVGGDDPSVAGRKIAVELKVDQDMAFGDRGPKPGYYAEPPSKSNTWDGKYHGSYYKVVLNIGGRDYALDEADTQKVLGLKAGSARFLEAVFGAYGYRGGKKVITRMPKGKAILTAFLAHLKSLPAPAMELLQRAADQMK